MVSGVDSSVAGSLGQPSVFVSKNAEKIENLRCCFMLMPLND